MFVKIFEASNNRMPMEWLHDIVGWFWVLWTDCLERLPILQRWYPHGLPNIWNKNALQDLHPIPKVSAIIIRESMLYLYLCSSVLIHKVSQSPRTTCVFGIKKKSRYSCDDYVCPKVNSVREKSRKRGRVCFIIGLFSEFEKTCDILPNRITLIFFFSEFFR